ncbi:MAG: type III-A CRISPR-associated protein Cas10/Csm1 [Anaerolineales bacterium]|nr:MAG: type III-A CRISPR-associated protein Cas10/Csm1 [Anaerolineales bacterium]
MTDELLKVTLAALLHDVGKFAQRIVPVAQRPKHTDAGADFVSRYVPEPFRAGLYPISTHHDPLEEMDRMTKVVALADRLVATEGEEEQETTPGRLRSVFDFVQLKPKEGMSAIPTPDEQGQEHYFPLKGLTLEDKKGPFPEKGKREVSEATYDTLWQSFVGEVERLAELPGQDLFQYIETLYYLLQKYTWCVPSTYYEAETDISLFDHSRVTAAIAACLWADDISKDQLDMLLNRDEEARQANRFLLLGGDISGVQDFIYTITSRGAAKGLRGRSVYLQLLTEAIARWLMRELELPPLNLLYVGGGNFYALLPLKAEDKLPRLQHEVSRRLLAIHGGDLYLAVEGIPISVQDFSFGRWGQRWHEVGQALGQAKQRRFSELGDKLHAVVFEPQGQGGEPQFCQVCQSDEGDTEERDDVRLCELCRSLEELGGRIAFAKWLVWGELEPTDVAGKRSWTWQDALAAFGARPMPIDRVEEASLAADVRRVIAYRIKDTRFLIEPEDKLPRAYGFRFLARAVPRLGRDRKRDDDTMAHKGDIATFNDLAEASKGIKRLGILRMDVDSLGLVFSEGLGERASISRVATLSFLMQLFFEGWLGRICDEWPLSKEGHGKLYLTYAGGDDLFLVGAWDAMPEVAWSIQQDFADFVGGNQNVTISAGISLVTKKFPIYQAAEMAHVALDDQAKRTVRLRDGQQVAKDAISFLGKPLGWEDFEVAQQMKELLRGLLKSADGRGPVSRALLTRLKQIYDLYVRNERAQVKQLLEEMVSLKDFQRDIQYDRWRWRLAYGLTRFKEGHREREEELDKVRKWIMEGGDTRIAYLDLPVRWVELLTRD